MRFSLLVAAFGPGLLALACGGDNTATGQENDPAKNASPGPEAASDPNAAANPGAAAAPARNPATPYLVSFSPGGAACVPVAQAIVATFSRTMDRASTEAAFSISPQVTGTFSWNQDSTVMTFAPNTAFAKQTEYKLELSRNAKDSDGHALAIDSRTHARANPSFVTEGNAARGSLECLTSFMAGNFDNEREYWNQVETNVTEPVKRIRLRLARAWQGSLPGIDARWLYVEQAVTYGDTRKDENLPYRQRLYRLRQVGTFDFESDIYTFRDRPISLSGNDFDTQVASKLTSDDDRWLIQQVYEKEPNGSYILVQNSFNYYRAVTILGGITKTPPSRIAVTDFASTILDNITTALLSSVNNTKYQTASLTVDEARALVTSMYPLDPSNASYRIPRFSVQVTSRTRLRDVFNAIGYNGGHNHDPLWYAGDWEKPAPIANLTLDDFDLREGCTVRLHWDSEKQTYIGGTTGKTCGSTLQGATYATSEARIFENGFVSWDRGFTAADQQVWGGNERYEFDKSAFFTVP